MIFLSPRAVRASLHAKSKMVAKFVYVFQWSVEWWFSNLRPFYNLSFSRWRSYTPQLKAACSNRVKYSKISNFFEVTVPSYSLEDFRRCFRTSRPTITANNGAWNPTDPVGTSFENPECLRSIADRLDVCETTTVYRKVCRVIWLTLWMCLQIGPCSSAKTACHKYFFRILSQRNVGSWIPRIRIQIKSIGSWSSTNS